MLAKRENNLIVVNWPSRDVAKREHAKANLDWLPDDNSQAIAHLVPRSRLCCLLKIGKDHDILAVYAKRRFVLNPIGTVDYPLVRELDVLALMRRYTIVRDCRLSVELLTHPAAGHGESGSPTSSSVPMRFSLL